MRILQVLSLAAAKIDTSGGSNTTSVSISNEMKDVVPNDAFNIAYFWAGIAAVIVIIVAGFFYATSQDDPSRVARAKNAILGAVIGLIVLFAAAAITTLVREALS